MRHQGVIIAAVEYWINEMTRWIIRKDNSFYLAIKRNSKSVEAITTSKKLATRFTTRQGADSELEMLEAKGIKGFVVDYIKPKEEIRDWGEEFVSKPLEIRLIGV